MYTSSIFRHGLRSGLVQIDVVRLEIALVPEPPETHLALELGLHAALVLDMAHQVPFLLVGGVALVGAHVSAVLVLREIHVPKC